MKILNLLAGIGVITVVRYACKVAIAINDVKAARKREEEKHKSVR